MNNGFPKDHPYYAPVKAEMLEASIIESKSHELQLKQTEALTSLAESVKVLTDFLAKGGLQHTLSGLARANIAQGILGGLAAKDGRDSLDARVIKQNALEITEIIDQVFDKVGERLKDKNRDPEIKEPNE